MRRPAGGRLRCGFVGRLSVDHPADQLRQHPAERIIGDRDTELEEAVHELDGVLRLDVRGHRCAPFVRAVSMLGG